MNLYQYIGFVTVQASPLEIATLKQPVTQWFCIHHLNYICSPILMLDISKVLLFHKIENSIDTVQMLLSLIRVTSIFYFSSERTLDYSF